MIQPTVVKQIVENGTLSLRLYEAPYYVPKFEIIFDDGLGYTCIVFGFRLPEYHRIYAEQTLNEKCDSMSVN